jgi:hypothetical protein
MRLSKIDEFWDMMPYGQVDIYLFLEVIITVLQLSSTKLHITNSKTISMVQPYLWS